MLLALPYTRITVCEKVRMSNCATARFIGLCILVSNAIGRYQSDKGSLMGESEQGSGLEPSCQAVSPNDEPCHHPATVRCTRCARRFCHNHADDHEWHSCALSPGEEGGEA